MLDVAKTGACVSARRQFAGTLPATARNFSSVRSLCAKRASVEPGVFIHISFAIARVSAKEQQELAMCWRWDRVSKCMVPR